MTHDRARPVPATPAGLKIGSFSSTMPIPETAPANSRDYATGANGAVTAVNFRINLPAGPARMEAWFGAGEGARGKYNHLTSAYYVYVTRVKRIFTRPEVH